MNNKEIRWRQRFDNFEKAFNQLRSGIEMFGQLDDLAKEGLIQRFEYTFELAWKILKDYLESKGTEAKFPREVIKSAYQAGLIDNGEIWMEMLDDRNLMAHTYDEKNFRSAVDKITRKYFGQLAMLHDLLLNEK